MMTRAQCYSCRRKSLALTCSCMPAMQVVSGSITLTATISAFLCSADDPLTCLLNPATQIAAANPIAHCKVVIAPDLELRPCSGTKCACRLDLNTRPDCGTGSPLTTVHARWSHDGVLLLCCRSVPTFPSVASCWVPPAANDPWTSATLELACLQSAAHCSTGTPA
jgi:hypothetical protein